MTQEELRQLVAAVQRRQCELDIVEVKAARGEACTGVKSEASGMAGST